MRYVLEVLAVGVGDDENGTWHIIEESDSLHLIYIAAADVRHAWSWHVLDTTRAGSDQRIYWKWLDG